MLQSFYFLLIEVINICLNKKHFSFQRTLTVVKQLLVIGIMFIETDLGVENLGSLIELVNKHNISSYDALYLLLAKEKKCKLLTFDDQLLKIKDLTTLLSDLKI